MAYTRGILAAIKFVQLAMSVQCLALHVMGIVDPNLPSPHNTLFCGTFMGFSLISVALFFGYCVQAPAPKGVDLFFGYFGGGCFFICGSLSMYYPMEETRLDDMTPDEEASDPFFMLCSIQAMSCFITALIYVFEACMLYDIWFDDLKQQKRLLSLRMGEQLTIEDEDEDSELGPLQLHCFCLPYLDSSLGWWRRRRESPHQRRRDEPPSPSAGPRSVAFKTPSQQAPGHGPTASTSREVPEIYVTPPANKKAPKRTEPLA